MRHMKNYSKKYPHDDHQIVWNNVRKTYVNKNMWHRGFDKKQILSTEIELESFNIEARFFVTGGLHAIAIVPTFKDDGPRREGWKITIWNNSYTTIAAQHEIANMKIQEVEKECLKLLSDFLDCE